MDNVVLYCIFSAAMIFLPSKDFEQYIFSSYGVRMTIVQETAIDNGLKFCTKRDLQIDK